MKWFGERGRQSDRLLPADIVSLMDMYGRSEFDPRGTGVGHDVDPMRKGMIDPDLYPAAQADPDAFVTTLATAVLPVSGWAAYGASRLIASLLGLDYSHPASDEIREAGLQWLRDNGVPPVRVAPYEWEFWLEHGGKTERWLRPRVGYRPADAPISDLGIQEVRRIAQLTAEPESNVLFACRDAPHEYKSIIDAPYSDEDPRRSQRVGVQAETLRDLYMRIGEGLQMLPYWCDSELEAFIPYDRPRIPIF